MLSKAKKDSDGVWVPMSVHDGVGMTWVAEGNGWGGAAALPTNL